MQKSLKVWTQKFWYTVYELFSNWLLSFIPRFLLVTLGRVTSIMAWTYFSQFQNAGRQGATRESISHGVLLTEYWVCKDL